MNGLPIKKLASIAVATAMMACVVGGASATYAQDYQSSDHLTLDAGTIIPVTLNNELSSNNSQPGDTFTANVDTSREAYNSLMAGAVVDGVVRNVVPQSGNDPGTLQVAFTRLRLPDGTSYVINGTPTSLDASNLTVNSDGLLVAKNNTKDKSLTYAGVGAGAGALISLLGGGKLKIEDLLIGGGLGYIAGQVLKQRDQQVHDVDLKPGTSMGVLLGNAVLYHRRGMTSGYTTYTTSTPSTGLKFYTYHGQTWSYDPATGERRRVAATTTVTTTTTRTFHRLHRRYYSYMGHPFYLDLDTGQRVRLD